MTRRLAPARPTPKPTLATKTAAPAFDPAKDRPGYRDVPWRTVPDATRRAAERALKLARADLGLTGVLALVWYEDAAGAEAGFASRSAPNQVWVRASLAPWQAARVAAHEAHHLSWYRSGKSAGPEMEAAALAYEEVRPWSE